MILYNNLLAVDRVNNEIAYLYEPPAIRPFYDLYHMLIVSQKRMVNLLLYVVK